MSADDGPVRLGVDVGGTFTDLVVLGGGELRTVKVPSTPADQSGGVARAVETAGLGRIDAFAHGTTVATNALLERRGARIALVTTHGFRDVLEIARQDRAHLYDLTAARPAALVPRELRFTVDERMGPRGVVRRLDDASVRAAVEAVSEARVEAVAVCLLFAFRHPEHEQRVGRALAEALPDVHVSLSHEVLPEFREYERFATTAANAYLAPRLSAYLARLADRAGNLGLPAPLVMQSSGGVVDAATAGARAASCVLSGPAGGVVGAAHVARASGYDDVLTFDMGGTSTDVAPVPGGEAATTTEATVAGVPIRHPAVDVHTVSAGGGSIASGDAGGALRVGPESAGAEPGPAAYGRGGERPTVTDANLLVGHLADGVELGGEVTLRRDLAERALAALGDGLGLDAHETALGVIGVANAEMVRALRVISVERGLDPREFALVAFGGAGGMHACALAEELGMATVLVPRAGGVLSALGLALSDVRRDYVHPFLVAWDDLDPDELETAFRELEGRAAADLELAEQAFSAVRRADVRYRGQSYELGVEADDVPAIAARFHAAHARRFGYEMEDEPLELVNLRLYASVEVERPELREDPPADDPAEPGRRRVSLDGDWRDVLVLDRSALGAGSVVEGPAIVESGESTCVVRPGWRGTIDGAGTLVLVRA